MRIDQIEIQNFKRFEKQTLVLHPQFTLLVGDIEEELDEDDLTAAEKKLREAHQRIQGSDGAREVLPNKPQRTQRTQRNRKL